MGQSNRIAGGASFPRLSDAHDPGLSVFESVGSKARVSVSAGSIRTERGRVVSVECSPTPGDPRRRDARFFRCAVSDRVRVDEGLARLFRERLEALAGSVEEAPGEALQEAWRLAVSQSAALAERENLKRALENQPAPADSESPGSLEGAEKSGGRTGRRGDRL